MSSDAEFHGFAAMKAGGPMVPFNYKPLPLADDHVEIQILACGVCHSDLHQINNDWHIGNYPLVPGHEVIGKIVAMGPKASGVRIGQRVGCGPQIGCCEQCPSCKSGKENICAKQQQNYNSRTGDQRQPFTFGGFADRVRCSSKWVFPIPDGLDTAKAAPLMCAGITTWAPLIRSGAKQGSKVGIIGIGGLGHIAIQFASKLGCETVAISTSANKKDEAMKLGAQHFLNITDKQQVMAHNGTCDVLLSTVSTKSLDLTPYLSLLKREGKLATVAATTKVEFSSAMLVVGQLTLMGSFLASKSEIVEMLQFAADHKIEAMTEILPMNEQTCNEAMAKIEKNAVRYRMVLVRDGEN